MDQINRNVWMDAGKETAVAHLIRQQHVTNYDEKLNPLFCSRRHGKRFRPVVMLLRMLNSGMNAALGCWREWSDWQTLCR
jgi:hypothetical protein